MQILSGIQPNGEIHIGNYLGAIKQWVDLQYEYDALYCIVDLHAITTPYDREKLAHHTKLTAATYLACGVDPKKSSIFVQSHVRGHTELTWLLGCQTPLGWLNRMTQFKDKAGKHKEQASLGLYAYPVLQAADILLYKATHVPIGEDQKQHIELARDIAGAFNHNFETDLFPLPEPQIMGPATRVMSLRDGTGKMSKSDLSEYSRIHLMDDADTISQKIRKAKTDPEPLPDNLGDLAQRPEARNLLNIYAAFAGKTKEQVIGDYAGAPFSQFKPALAELIISKLSPVRSEIHRLLDDEAHLMKCLTEGRDHAQEIADKTLQRAMDVMGFLKK